MNPAVDRSPGAQADACRQAALYYSGRQSGPKPRSKEAEFLAGLLFEAERTLWRLNEIQRTRQRDAEGGAS